MHNIFTFSFEIDSNIKISRIVPENSKMERVVCTSCVAECILQKNEYKMRQLLDGARLTSELSWVTIPNLHLVDHKESYRNSDNPDIFNSNEGGDPVHYYLEYFQISKSAQEFSTKNDENIVIQEGEEKSICEHGHLLQGGAMIKEILNQGSFIQFSLFELAVRCINPVYLQILLDNSDIDLIIPIVSSRFYRDTRESEFPGVGPLHQFEIKITRICSLVPRMIENRHFRLLKTLLETRRLAPNELLFFNGGGFIRSDNDKYFYRANRCGSLLSAFLCDFDHIKDPIGVHIF